MTNIPEILRHMADNVEKGLPARCGVQYRCIGKNWFDLIDDNLSLGKGGEYRIKPATVTVNGREIDEHLREPPNSYSHYYVPAIGNTDLFDIGFWRDEKLDIFRLKNGLCFDTKEKAIAYSKAVLGIE